MKILMVCQYYYPEQFKINDICSTLVKQGHKVSVLTGLPNYPSGIIEKGYKKLKKRREVINGVHVTRSLIIARGKGNIRLALNYISFVVSASINALFIKKDFDLIFVYQLSPATMAIPGILLKKITKKPMLLYCFDLWPESIVSGSISKKSKTYSMLFKICRWIYNKADKILVSSNQFKEYFKTTLNIYKDISYLPIYAESLFENIGKISNNKINFVFAGNIGEMQSVETIVYAANEVKENKNILIHIVGDGSSRKKCEELAKNMALDNIIFHGQYPTTEMPKFYELADAFLVTLKNDKMISYTLPGKVQTYMASGKPIIGAINGEAAMIINKAHCGLCSPAEDYKALAKSIISFIKNKEKYSDCGKNARIYYENNFSKEICIGKLNRLMLSII